MAHSLLVGNGTVITLGKSCQVLPQAGVLIRDDTIHKIGPTEQLRAEAGAAEYLDAGGRLIVPGFICAHHHLYSTFACGLAFAPAGDFVEVLERLWWKLDRALELEDVYLSAKIQLARCIMSGTTTLIDHHASPLAITGSLGRIGDAVTASGLRASLCYEVTDRNGPDGARLGLQENRDWLTRCRAAPRLHGLVGIHASFTVGDQTLGHCVTLARDFGTGVHVHVAESPADQRDSLTRYRMRVVERLHRAGALGPSSLLAHCVHVDPAEMELIRAADAVVLHNPQSNMNNAVGSAAVPQMLAKGIRVGLGTDGMTSNMLEEARASLFIRRHVAESPAVGFGDTVRMLWENNAAVASSLFGRRLGTLEEGGQADVLITNHVPFTPVTPDNVFGHLLFGVAGSGIDTTICDGQVLMRAGQLQTIDYREACEQAARRAPRTWQRFQQIA